MRILLGIALALTAAVGVSGAISADARRGAAFFEQQKCNTCHSVAGEMRPGRSGGAPDLAVRLNRDYTPAGVASRMWNHAPTMWSAMARQGITPPAVSEQDAADLFAFFYSVRYFDTPGDAGRGKRLFTERKCAECHADAVGRGGSGTRIQQWQSVKDPVALVAALWNHIPKMKDEFAAKKISWPALTNQELADMMVFLRTLPEMRKQQFEFAIPAGGSGQRVFEEKGCGGCHTGGMALERRLGNRNLTDIAVAMWNHGPKMKQVSPISDTEMAQLLGHLWANSFFSASGNPARGKSVFESKQCGACHTQDNIPKLSGSETTVVSMVSALWKHGPGMLNQLRQKNMSWPQLTPNQMADVVAYIGRPAK
jgi:mono/diheme cytochrome c family protein